MIDSNTSDCRPVTLALLFFSLVTACHWIAPAVSASSPQDASTDGLLEDSAVINDGSALDVQLDALISPRRLECSFGQLIDAKPGGRDLDEAAVSPDGQYLFALPFFAPRNNLNLSGWRCIRHEQSLSDCGRDQPDTFLSDLGLWIDSDGELWALVSEHVSGRSERELIFCPTPEAFDRSTCRPVAVIIDSALVSVNLDGASILPDSDPPRVFFNAEDGTGNHVALGELYIDALPAEVKAALPAALHDTPPPVLVAARTGLLGDDPAWSPDGTGLLIRDDQGRVLRHYAIDRLVDPPFAVYPTEYGSVEPFDEGNGSWTLYYNVGTDFFQATCAIAPATGQ